MEGTTLLLSWWQHRDPQPRPLLLTLYLGLLCWSSSASSISSVSWTLVFHLLGCSLAWLRGGLAAGLGLAFLPALSLPNTTVSHSLSHLSRQRLVYCRGGKQGHPWSLPKIQLRAEEGSSS